MARRKSPPSTGIYLFELALGDPHYALSTNSPRFRPAPYSEYLHLQFVGHCLSPKKHAGQEVPLTILGDREYFRGSSDPNWKPLGVGHLTLRRDRSEYLATLPYDAAWGVAQGVATGLFKYLHLSGEALARGNAQVTYMSFQAQYDPDELLD